MTLHVAHKMNSNVFKCPFKAFHVYLYLQSVKNWPSFPTVSGKSWVQTARVFSDRACGQICSPCGTSFETEAWTKHSISHSVRTEKQGFRTQILWFFCAGENQNQSTLMLTTKRKRKRISPRYLISETWSWTNVPSSIPATSSKHEACISSPCLQNQQGCDCHSVWHDNII